MTSGLSRVEDAWVVQGQVRASGALGPLGIDADLRSNTSSDKSKEASAWLGARYRAFRLGQAAFELAPIVRIGVPTIADGTITRLETAIALGGVAGRLTWLSDITVARP